MRTACFVIDRENAAPVVEFGKTNVNILQRKQTNTARSFHPSDLVTAWLAPLTRRSSGTVGSVRTWT